MTDAGLVGSLGRDWNGCSAVSVVEVSMGRRREFDTDEALTRALGVFWDRGYEATSIEDLTAATGLSRSSIYSTFGSKRGLFDAVMEHYLEGIGEILGPLEEGEGGIDDLLRFFEMWRDRTRTDVDGSLGCLMINTMAERGHVDPDIAELGSHYLTRFRSAFERALEAAAERGEVRATAISQMAGTLMLMTTGFFVASRGQSRQHIEEMMDTIVSHVESLRVPTDGTEQ